MSEDIVAGIDESPSAGAASRWAASHARSTGARLRAIQVLEWREARDLYATPVRCAQVYPDADELDPARRAGGRRVFTTIDPEPSWTLQLASGHAGQVMVGVSSEAALLVLGTHEHRGLGRLGNGSVGHYGIKHAVCPVVTVPTLPAEGVPPPRARRPPSDITRLRASRLTTFPPPLGRTTMSELDHRFHHLPAVTCRQRLDSGTIGRVGWSSHGGPQILPVTYLVHDDQIIFRTDPHGPLASLQGGEPAVLEVDEFDPATRCGWSVVVRGRAYSTQHSPRATQLSGEADPVPWAGGRRPMFISITLDELSGRSVERQREDDDEERKVPA